MSTWFDPLIAKAKAGHDGAARALLHRLAEYLEHGEVPPAEVAEYFATAFKLIASGRKADDELHLGKSTHFKRDYEIAWAVWKLTHQAKDHLPLRASMKHREGARDVVAGEYSMSAENVERIYKDMRGLVEAEAFQMTLGDGEDREGPELPEKVRQQLKEARQHFEVDLHITLGKVVESLKKHPGGDAFSQFADYIEKHPGTPITFAEFIQKRGRN